jgi:hypothetical protein
MESSWLRASHWNSGGRSYTVLGEPGAQATHVFTPCEEAETVRNLTLFVHGYTWVGVEWHDSQARDSGPDQKFPESHISEAHRAGII